MALATRTYLQLCEAVADNLDARRSGTLTTITTALATAANYPFKTARTNASNKAYEGSELYFTGTHQFTPNPNGIAAYSASAGTFTPNSAWTDGGTDPTTFDIFMRGITISDLKTAVNAALSIRRYTTTVPLSWVVDGDCDKSTTTDWGATVNAAVSKVASTGNIRGSYYLRVTNSGANGYVLTSTYRAVKGASFYVQADVYDSSAVASQADLVAWDLTNSAEIKYESWDDQGWGRISFTFTLPATCDLFCLRLRGVSASAIINWDDIMLLPLNETVVYLPDYVTERSQVRNVFTSSTKDYTNRDNLVEIDWWGLQENSLNPASAFLLKLSPIRGPVWIEISRPFAALSADGDTTTMNQRWAEVASTVELLRVLINRYPSQEIGYWTEKLNSFKRRLSMLDAHHSPKPTLHHSFLSPPSVP